MKQGVLLISSIVAITLISGCVSTLQSLGTDNALDIIENPAKYDNKEVRIIGSPISSLNVNFYPEYKYAILKRNEEGKPLELLVKYERFYCLNCEITGIIKAVKTCECRSDYYYGADKVTPVEKCENPPQNLRIVYKDFNCKPNSERDVYYLDVTKVKSLDE